MRNWQKFLRLRHEHQWLFLQALVMLPIVALALKFWGLKRLYRRLDHWVPFSPAHLPPQQDGHPQMGEVEWQAIRLNQASTVSRLVQAAAKYGWRRANCLHRSLTLWYLLRQQGFNPTLRIGVSKMMAHLEAHAWIELQGTVINDHPDIGEKFIPFSEPIDWPSITEV